MWTNACSDPHPQWEAVYSQGRSAFERGDFDIALAKAEAGFRKSTSDPKWNYKFRDLEAEVLFWQGEKEKTLDLLRSSPPADVVGTESAIRRNIILGTALISSRPSEVPALLDEAGRLASNVTSGLLADVALTRGLLAGKQDIFDKALQEFQRALKLSRQTKNSFVEAEALGNLGRLFTRMRRYDEAKDSNNLALTVNKSHDFRRLQAGVLINLGWNYLELGDFDNALDAFKRYEDFSSDPGLKEIADLNIGRIYHNQGDDKAASEYFKHALEIATRRENRSEAGKSLDNLALAVLGLGDKDGAYAYNQRALKIHREEANGHAEEMRSLLTAAIIAYARNDLKTAEPLLRQVIHDADTFPSVRLEAEAVLADIYAARRKTSLAREQFKSVLNEIEHVRLKIDGDENRLAFSFWEARFHTEYIRFLADQKDTQGALQVTELMRARTLEEGMGGGIKHSLQPQVSSAKKALKRNQVIMAYWLAPERSFLWVITPSTIRFFTLPAKEKIDVRVKLYQESINAAKDVEQGDENGEALYRMLVGPAKALIPARARVVVIPDGSLGRLNFETLLAPGEHPHFWIRDVEVQDASSIALLMKPRPNHTNRKKLLIMGDPIEADPQYPRLRYAGSEMVQIAAGFSSGKMAFPGEKAIPSAYESARPGEYDAIHFATHGFASEKSPLDSAIILSRQTDGAFKLYARDIIKVPIKARIVVISACYGAGKRTYSAEGLVGLAWAFLRAGAHQVIAGLWNVDDESTSTLMTDFYNGWQKSNNAAAALRSAKLNMLTSPEKAFHRPYYWAALQLYTGS
ncbi:MAG TPA: CHAT domain-containing tetratricopeptide repeat protein [Candidatus Saccharimonadales bacterium]|jgi:CHAT domain-containing protein|nr:CHAT domain-containing tetratricopeptide repeat protein [Candidatus Saccharimonadales bacterium]